MSDFSASTSTSNKYDFNEDILIQLLKEEDKRRRSQEVQDRMFLAESKYDTEWMDVATDVQKSVVKDYLINENIDLNPNKEIINKCVHQLRLSALQHPEICHYVKYNKARNGNLRVGDLAPDIQMCNLDGKFIQLLDRSNINASLPMVLIAGSYS